MRNSNLIIQEILRLNGGRNFPVCFHYLCCSLQGFLQKDKKYPVARVFPYGGYKIKAAEKKDVKSRSEAESVALESLPDETTKVSTMEELQQCVRRGYAAKPLKMPVLLLTGNLLSRRLSEFGRRLVGNRRAMAARDL